MLGWTAVMFAVQQWMSETSSQRSKSGTPAIFSVGMAVLAVLVVCLKPSHTDLPIAISGCYANFEPVVHAIIHASAGTERTGQPYRTSSTRGSGLIGRR